MYLLIVKLFWARNKFVVVIVVFYTAITVQITSIASWH